MNRINNLFEQKKGNILSIYFTAGYPKLNDTNTILNSLQEAGADLVEVGIPFSDPLADGPVIQQSSTIALQNGMNLELLFDQLRSLRQKTLIPVLLMGYINPILKFGIEKFYFACSEVGIDGLILPDLPLQEFDQCHKPLAEKYNIHVVFVKQSSILFLIFFKR